MNTPSLEEPPEREFALSDPRGFLRRFKGGVILDEIQRAPGLPSYLQIIPSHGAGVTLTQQPAQFQGNHRPGNIMPSCYNVIMSIGGGNVILKTIGQSGQLSIGKEYAGRHVIVDELEPGTWLIKTGEFIPDNEGWMWDPPTAAKIERAVKWAETNSSSETDLDALERCVKKGKSKR